MVVQYVMWGLLVGSSLLLLYLWFRKGQAGRSLSFLGINLLIAVFLLFVINLLSQYTNVSIPFNYWTLSTVTFLGIPGLFLLVTLKLVLM
ncbi:pro-sigmaK processing inhibitor BofA family protein [Paenibacillus sp. GP183]|jgi:inhibitor of the pro-sigma K processing machinery|uniref:pro-sigmaK processing inhibitor BofA family protein n=1 Tax=Paenibacillus sp. GP183 TaxID=1882751 RepID=UPI00089B1623|nr:pro-sigmaK processing inhibitor BofA family protein [Paenibacillus sp. GP183]SEC21694.1 inhibitor of the pro-sigma K processing machinery [Paenibacillus sp. GP183]